MAKKKPVPITLKVLYTMILNVEDRIKRNQASLEIKVGALDKRLQDFASLFSRLEIVLMARIDDVIAAVAEETTIIASVGALLDKLTADIADLREDLVEADADTAKVDELLEAVEANKDVLIAQVLKNTPQEGDVEGHGLTM